MKSIIVDLDGTLIKSPHVPFSVNQDGNGIVEYDKWILSTVNAQPNEWCMNLVKVYASADYNIIFLSARRDIGPVKKITENWLKRHIGSDIKYELHIRPLTSIEADDEFKMNYFKTTLNLKNVELVIDDKLSVCEMFRSEFSIPALHCATPTFK